MKKVQIRSALGTGWSQFRRRPWYLLGISLAFIFLLVLTAGDGLMSTALSYILYGGFVALLLKHAAGEQVKFDNLFDIVDKRWIYFAFLGLIKNILIALGFLCLIVPGIYLSVRWMFADLFVIDQGLTPMAALKASSELTAGVRWSLLLYGLVVGFLMIISIFALIIGAVVAAVVVQLATIKLYHDLRESVTDVVPEPSEG